MPGVLKDWRLFCQPSRWAFFIQTARVKGSGGSGQQDSFDRTDGHEIIGLGWEENGRLFLPTSIKCSWGVVTWISVRRKYADDKRFERAWNMFECHSRSTLEITQARSCKRNRVTAFEPATGILIMIKAAPTHFSCLNILGVEKKKKKNVRAVGPNPIVWHSSVFCWIHES